jgi:hypothetical protein
MIIAAKIRDVIEILIDKSLLFLGYRFNYGTFLEKDN